MAEGLIRCIVASLDSCESGFRSTLMAVNVERAAEIIGQFPEVTHSYLRKDDFNIWLTIIVIDNERIEYILDKSVPLYRLGIRRSLIWL